MLKTILFGLLAALLAACNPEPQDEVTGVRKALEELQQKYDGLIEDRGGDPVQWAADDIENLGDWDYRVERIAFTSEEAFAEQLNALGDDRWEVLWLERTPDGFLVILKKPSISYLSKIPLSQLGRLLIPGGEGGP